MRDRMSAPFHLENDAVAIGRDLRELVKFETAQEGIDLIDRGIGMNRSQTLFADGERIGQVCIDGAASDEQEGDDEKTVDQNTRSTISWIETRPFHSFLLTV